jgi:hypothetical protein
MTGAALFTIGFLIGLRFIFYYWMSGGTGHIQSLILAALLMGIGIALVVAGLMADLMAVNRTLLEALDVRLKHLEAGSQHDRD